MAPLPAVVGDALLVIFSGTFGFYALDAIKPMLTATHKLACQNGFF